MRSVLAIFAGALRGTTRSPGTIKRRTDEGSWVELAARTAAVRRPLTMRLYLYDGWFLLCRVAGSTEVGEVMRLKQDVSDHELGLLICDHLLQFRRTEPQGVRTKQTDWPAYRASGARSVRAFESKAWMVQVFARGGAIDIVAAPRKTLKPQLAAHYMATARHTDIGAGVRSALKAAQTLREQAVL